MHGILNRVLLSALLALTVQGATADTLGDALKRGTLRFGYWPGEVPFSDRDVRGNPVGYSVDLCTRIAEMISSKLNTRLEPDWVAINASTRASYLDEKKTDLVCADITNTRARQEHYDFSYTIFVAGTRFMSRKADKLEGWPDLQGKRVAVVRNTAAEALVKELDAAASMQLDIASAQSIGEAWQWLEKGEVVAVGYDDIVQSTMSEKTADGPGAYQFTGAHLSIEPYGFMMRKNDPAFRAAVNEALAVLFRSGEVLDIYARWFTNSQRNIPVSMHLREDFRTPNAFPAFP